MNPPRKYGETAPGPVIILPEMVIDFSDGKPLPPGLGQTETPVNVLSEMVIDMSEAAPALAVTFRLRPDARPAAVAFDLVAAFAALNRYEISLGGSGLTPDESRSDLSTGSGVVRLVLAAADATKAADRLGKLVTAVNGVDPAVPREALAGRSFAGCMAELRAAA